MTSAEQSRKKWKDYQYGTAPIYTLNCKRVGENEISSPVKECLFVSHASSTPETLKTETIIHVHVDQKLSNFRMRGIEVVSGLVDLT